MALFGKKDEEHAANLVFQQLRLAADRRARFYVVVRTRDGKQHSLPGLIESYEGPTLLIDMSSGVRLSSAWKGQTVECYFRIVAMAPQRTEQHFMFASRILDIRALSTGLIVELQKPAAIESGQRRRSVRVRPVPELVGLLEMRRDQSPDDGPLTLAALDGYQRIIGMAAQNLLEGEAPTVPPAPAPAADQAPVPASSPASDPQPGLVDISAGGLRACIAPRAGEDGERGPLARGDRVVLRAILHWPGGAHQPLDVLLKAEVSTRMSTGSVAGGVDVGVEFLADGKVDADGTVTWVPVRDGVYRIAQWVNAVYMEYMRKVRSQ
uniref:Type IV pilus assembly PilZ n=1 Tax=Nitratidesulfovibrio vulgaris (strain DSM 19637 / Miyazaki F) TaxID=883 RepID=B8DMD0_NITV9